VASIARDDPSTLPGDDPFPCARMHRESATAMRGKLGSEFEISYNANAQMHFRHRQTDTDIVALKREMYILHLALKINS